jgi:hypothetical protein
MVCILWQPNREGIMDIKAKISALLAKNVDNGASESEAIAAMGIAQRLMVEHGVTMEDILENRSVAKDFIREVMRTGRKNLHEVDLYCVGTIAEFFDVKVWQNKVYEFGEKVGVTVQFFGYVSDVELAKYLREVIFRAMEWEWSRYSNSISNVGHKRSIRKSFLVGMSGRLCERMRQIKSESRGTGTELIVLKGQMVTQAWVEQVNIKLNKTYRTVNVTDGPAYRAGVGAGDRVNISRNKDYITE